MQNELNPCHECGNTYLAIRTDIHKDKREFVYCDCCGLLAQKSVWNRIAAPSAEASAQDDWAPYLKEGETPLDRLKREIKDNEAVTSLLAKERTKNATAPPAADAGGVKDERDAMADLRKAERSLSFLCDLLPAEFMWGDSLQADALDEILDRYDSALSRKAEQPAEADINGLIAEIEAQPGGKEEVAKAREWAREQIAEMAEQPAEAQDLPPLPEWLTRTDKGTLVPRSLVIEALRGYARAAIAADRASRTLDHAETVLRVQEALGFTTTGFVAPDVILLRIWQAKCAAEAQGEGLTALRLIHNLNGIAMHFAADLTKMETHTIKGINYLRRDAVMQRTIQWRQEWDKTSPEQQAIAAHLRAAGKGGDGERLDVESVARAMALHAGWEEWDTATDCRHTPSGNDPDEEREYWLELARIAIAAKGEKGGAA